MIALRTHDDALNTHVTDIKAVALVQIADAQFIFTSALGQVRLDYEKDIFAKAKQYSV